MNTEAHSDLLNRIRSVIQKVLCLEKTNRLEIEGVRLYPSEIHVLLLVEAGKGTKATGMAEELGITKGAISQTVTRLERKGLLTKERNPQAKNELTLSFTPLGRRAARRYQKLQIVIWGRFDAYLQSVSAGERSAIGRFLREMSSILDEVR
jgi:DNA-binding MarR family transcriptional regulator